MIQRLLALLFVVALSPFASADLKEEWDTLKKHEAPLPSRMAAAKLIAERANKDKECGKIANDFIELGLKANTPPELRSVLCDALSSCPSDEGAKALMKHIGQGQPTERGWVVRAARGMTWPELDKALASKALTDDDSDIRQLTVDVLVQHKFAGAIPAFEAILKAGKDTDVLGPVVTGISKLQTGTPGWDGWETRLVEYAKSKNDTIRRAALAVVAQEKNVAQLDLFLEALGNADWSTRALALGFLEKCGSKKAVGAIIEQMRREPTGTRMSIECERALARMSGMNFGDRVEDWATWWKNTEATFEFPKSSGNAKTAGPRPPRLDTGTGVAKFYGIEIESKRVIFVIDISGSMMDPTKDPVAPGTPRIEVAKRELAKIVDELPPGSLFNIITFNDSVEGWLDHIGDLPSNLGPGTGGKKGGKAPATGDPKKDEKPKDDAEKKRDDEKQKKLDDALRAKAKEYVSRLSANRGTNIYDAFEKAFDDPVVDTIFFLTDGLPSVGEETDPQLIREAVARWNLTRKIKINTIAIGFNFDYLHSISSDSGGEHKYLE